MGYSPSSFWHLARAVWFTAAVASALPAAEQDFKPEDIITRDICILGAGATGTYAAVRLKDMGRSVAVIERNDRLGGHAETLYLPDGNHIDYGVMGYFNDNVTVNYFRRLDVDWEALLPATLNNDHVNFKTGEKVPPPSNILSTTAAALLYRLSIEKFSYLKEGVLDLPDPVPEELVRPFGEFVEKHSLEGALELIFTFAQGHGNILEVPALYVINHFGIPQVNALFAGYIRPRNGVFELYRKAAEYIDPDVLYQTTVAGATRSDSGVSIVVQSADGSRKLVKARKLLITIPPTLKNLKHFDLDESETNLFKKWLSNSYYCAVLNNTDIPDNLNVVNTDPNNQPGSLPHVPLQWHLDSVGLPSYLTTKIVAPGDFTAQDARDLIVSDIRRMRAAGTYSTREPEILAFGDHTPVTMNVSPDDIRQGFYRKLYALQGQRSTFYTGFTFCSDYSSLLWAYTDEVIGQMLDS